VKRCTVPAWKAKDVYLNKRLSSRQGFLKNRFNRSSNCVFHSLAQRYPEVCYFDLAMMSEVVDGDVIRDECMVRDGNVCRFKFKERP
jgi:hypothetical protein